MKFEIIPNEQTPEISPMGDVKEFIENNRQALASFLTFASMQSTAVGLAGNQVSLDGERFMHRVFALIDLVTKEWRLIINPVIEEYIGIKELKEEGCLTWKGKIIVAERSHRVKVSYYNFDGQKIEGEMHKGFAAQIIQHECNHLNGVVERIEENSFQLSPSKKIGRNDLCPCGSGKKYKQCCIN